MSGVQNWLWIGIALGAVWAFTGLDGAAITAAVGAVGLLLGLLIHQGGGLRNLLDQDDRQL